MNSENNKNVDIIAGLSGLWSNGKLIPSI